MKLITRNSNEREIFAATLYAEARGEPTEGQIWVAHVIKNRARLNKSYWGGNTIAGVCLKAGMFECWDSNPNGISINEEKSYQIALDIVDKVSLPSTSDPTGGADHYYNPKKIKEPKWVANCLKVKEIGDHTFFRTKPELL